MNRILGVKLLLPHCWNQFRNWYVTAHNVLTRCGVIYKCIDWVWAEPFFYNSKILLVKVDVSFRRPCNLRTTYLQHPTWEPLVSAIFSLKRLLVNRRCSWEMRRLKGARPLWLSDVTLDLSLWRVSLMDWWCYDDFLKLFPLSPIFVKFVVYFLRLLVF